MMTQQQTEITATITICDLRMPIRQRCDAYADGQLGQGVWEQLDDEGQWCEVPQQPQGYAASTAEITELICRQLPRCCVSDADPDADDYDDLVNADIAKIVAATAASEQYRCEADTDRE